MRSIGSLLVALVAVLALAACGGGTGDGNGGGGAGVSLTGMNDLSYSQTEVTAQAGEISLELICEEAINHDITIEGRGGEEPVVACDAGATATGTTTLEAGTYTFYCSVLNHREAGMEGTLTVQGG